MRIFWLNSTPELFGLFIIIPTFGDMYVVFILVDLYFSLHYNYLPSIFVKLIFPFLSQMIID